MRLRRLTAVVTSMAIVGGGLIASSAITGAQEAPAPFACNNDTYFLYNTVSDGLAHFSRVTDVGADAVVTDFGTLAQPLNAMGYNPADNFLYAIAQNNSSTPGALVRIGANGETTNLGTPDGLDGTKDIPAGTFVAPDRFVVSEVVDVPELVTTLKLIDIPTNAVIASVTAPGLFADYATNPLDDTVYGYDQLADRLSTIDLSTGAVDSFGELITPGLITGSAWFLDSGQMFLYGGPADQNTLYEADAGTNASGTGALTSVATGPVARGTDGASCVTLPDDTPTTPTTTPASPTTTASPDAPAPATVAAPRFTG